MEDEDEFVDIDSLVEPRPPALTTTQLGVQRLQGVPDTYQPGTLPPRLYQNNPFAVQAEVTETGENEYQLTAQERPATAEEVRRMTEEEEDEVVLSQAINSLITTTQAGRKRKATPKVMENIEQAKSKRGGRV
jgi:hypothetical protein